MDKKKDIGLLIIRLGLGIMFVIHGYPKLLQGPELWVKVGSAMQVFHINFAPAFWGFMASASEFFGGILLILGLFFSPACLFLFITMFVASSMHLSSGQGIGNASHAIELAVVFFGLFFTGPGKLVAIGKGSAKPKKVVKKEYLEK